VAILVFSDEGRMSIRADSELLIRHYEIDPAGTRTRIELEFDSQVPGSNIELLAWAVYQGLHASPRESFRIWW
jgi:hypothetical protein